MKIGIASPITISEFLQYLDEDVQKRTDLPKGMKASSVDAVAHGLLREGNEVSIYTLDPNVSDIVVLKGGKLNIYVAPYRLRNKYLNFLNIFRFRRNNVKRMIAMDEKRPDIIHAHWTREYALGAMSYTSSIPVIVTVRDWMPKIVKLFNYQPFWICNWIMDFMVFSNAKKITLVSNSDYMHSQIKKRWHIDTRVINNPASIEFSCPPSKSEQNKKTIDLISITTTISANKNIETLLKAVRLIADEYPQLRLHLAGADFVEDNEYIQKWRAQGLMHGVILEGYVAHSKLKEIFRKCDIMVHPSFEESFGNILLESISCGVPVIAGQNSGAVPYVLGHGAYGLLCDVTSPEAIADKIRYCITNYEECLSKTKVGVEHIREEYDVNQITQKTLNLYNDILNDRNIQ